MPALKKLYTRSDFRRLAALPSRRLFLELVYAVRGYARFRARLVPCPDSRERAGFSRAKRAPLGVRMAYAWRTRGTAQHLRSESKSAQLASERLASCRLSAGDRPRGLLHVSSTKPPLSAWACSMLHGSRVILHACAGAVSTGAAPTSGAIEAAAWRTGPSKRGSTWL